ncbi:GlxA family transcriptional regulator [Streptomyces anulatus]|uniref:GlxA family transcriptional regulator n=1 Tax=Streptomyces anulatus TaxID=1892 RepID=UPI0033CF118F
MHVVVVLAFDEVNGFDLAIPCEVFRHARSAAGERLYDVRVCGPGGPAVSLRTGVYDLRPTHGLRGLDDADTVIVPGLVRAGVMVPGAVLDALRAAVARGARVASICTGSFVLAAAGLLDGLSATTHWKAAGRLARTYPGVEVVPEMLFVDTGQILTAAGMSAGCDLCFHLVRQDFGVAVAEREARFLVMPALRDGAQTQTVRLPAPGPGSASLQPLLAWALEHLSGALTVGVLARQHGTSPRTLARRFEEQLGTTPSRWVRSARLKRAQVLLESTELSVPEVAEQTGFGSAGALREEFGRSVGTSPQQYRRAHRARGGR